MTTRLNQLSNLVSAEERECIGTAIAEKVGSQLMTPAELEQFEEDRSELGESSKAIARQGRTWLAPRFSSEKEAE